MASEGAVMAGVLKKTTGLVGLAVCNTPHERLRILYTKILDVLEDIPKNAAYRKYTEQIINEKLAMVKAEPDVQKLEDQLQGGQLEEVILQAENELSLARKMVQGWARWLKPDGRCPESHPRPLIPMCQGFQPLKALE
ncbi:NADH dehydrogenase [ubiquinone] 1 alpha subcomplex subunit 5-like [Cebus imitator]|uniref:NADH dehydrogenase [ubiquinone] 1 alpha subcomplex subunit 5-like n=1 Tax=Cebus imitator TaxID=2715852 RepID=UPI001896D429|nr:NADH dehydrogenase [ubiquinone] 1 alpha subcomplex subunit 5-like [Cebus imitator]